MEFSKNSIKKIYISSKIKVLKKIEIKKLKTTNYA